MDALPDSVVGVHLEVYSFVRLHRRRPSRNSGRNGSWGVVHFRSGGKTWELLIAVMALQGKCSSIEPIEGNHPLALILLSS